MDSARQQTSMACHLIQAIHGQENIMETRNKETKKEYERNQRYPIPMQPSGHKGQLTGLAPPI